MGLYKCVCICLYAPVINPCCVALTPHQVKSEQLLAARL